MRKNKKLMMAVSFGVGALMFVSTAYADIASQSSYEQFKNSIKYTAESCTEKLQSYTINATFTVKDGDKVLFTGNNISKIDNAKKATEDSSSTLYSDGKKESSYSYRDNKQGIWYNQNDDVYYVTDYLGERTGSTPSNPFKEEREKDVEKIFDAVVGNLSNYVLIDEKADGTKEFSGSLSETQIPAIVNAVSSFAFKQMSSDMSRREQILIPELKDDIFIKNVKGDAAVNKDGIIQSLLASGELSGKDSKGNVHDITIEFLGKIDNINSTTITPPDLNGKKVERNTEAVYTGPTLSKKFIGKYKNDVIIQEGDSFVKIGERFVEITDADSTHATGKYYEQYKPEYSKYGENNNSFMFNAQVNKNSLNADFSYTTSSGDTRKGSISFDSMLGKIYLYGNNFSNKYNGEFLRVFED